MNKEIVHVWSSNYLPGESVYLLENGNLLRTIKIYNQNFIGGGTGGGIQEMSPDGNVIWEFEYSNYTHLSHHDIEVLPNGNILMIAWESKTRSQAISAGRDPSRLNQELWPEHIIEVEPTGSSGGNIVWEWHVWDHLIQDYDATKENYGTVSEHPELIDINYMHARSKDWLHINSIDYNEDLDQIILSVSLFSEIWIIEHGGNSDILYRWGNPQAYKAGSSNDRELFHQHDAQWIENGLPGAGNILYFNNGLFRPTGLYSSVEEIVPPILSNGTYKYSPGLPYEPEEQHWIYTDDLYFYSRFQSGVQRLPDGNTLICESETGRIFEINQNEDIIWEYINPYPSIVSNHVFKSQRYNTNHPGIKILLNNFEPNNPPETPTTPDGPTIGLTGISSYTFNTSSIDIDGDHMIFGWDWDDDDIVDQWSDYYQSNEICIINHTWYLADIYNIKVKAKDFHGDESNWSNTFTVSIENNPNNNPPKKPSIPYGPLSGKAGINYTYNTSTIDPDNDNLYYLFDWDDGSNSNWFGPFESAEKVTVNHKWNDSGNYNIKVKAKDFYGVESEWSDPLTITMPKINNMLDMFLKLLNNHPLIYYLLQKLMLV